MSYDIYLKEPATGEVIELPFEHVMVGGTYKADYNEALGIFLPSPTKEAHINITYNYGCYYYEATERDERFMHKERQYEDGKVYMVKKYGIRGIYGKTGAESIPLLKDMIRYIEEKYKNGDDWIETKRLRIRYYDRRTGESLHYYDIISKGLTAEDYIRLEYKEPISEGDTEDYWEATAANAIKPLYQMIAMAQLRPDGVWDGD